MPSYLTAQAVNAAVVEIYRNIYRHYDAALNARVEQVDDSSDLWHREKVRFDAGDGGEAVVAYLFLPRHAKPPFACVVNVPSDTALQAGSGESIRPDAFILRSGRAMLYPIFKGILERYARPAPRDPVGIRISPWSGVTT